MANYVYIAASLDGFIAEKDGGIEWLNTIPNPEQTDFGYADFIKNIDAIVMGRNSYEKVLTFGEWPYDIPFFVLSDCLTELPGPLGDTVEIVNGDIKTILNRLNQRGYHNLYVDGGATIQSFLKEDLIDEMIITSIPILLGDGLPLFGKLEKSLNFSHKKTEIFNNGLVKSHYSRIR